MLKMSFMTTLDECYNPMEVIELYLAVKKLSSKYLKN